jgi:AraC-like DNA-binding protein
LNVEILEGKDFFSVGEDIFINRSEEDVERHLHIHDYIEIAYVAEGKGIHLIDGNEFDVSKGDLFIINYDVSHGFRSLADSKSQRLIVYNCIFRPKFIDQNLINSRNFSDFAQVFLFSSLFEEGKIGNDMKLLGNNNAEIGELYAKMYQEYSNKTYGYIEILRAYLIELLIKIFRLNKQEATDYDSDRDKRYFDDVIRFMKQNYNEDIRLDDLAAITFLSRNYFCTRFKECTGVTVVEHLQNLRIEEACKLLRTTTKNVPDIIEAVGYSDIKFFNKLFKKIVKKSPSDYRKSFNT